MGDQRVVERSKRGNTNLIIVLDQFFKFVLFKPLRQANSVNVVEYLESEVFNVFEVPETLMSDNGVQFVSKIFADLMSKYGVRHVCTASHAP